MSILFINTFFFERNDQAKEVWSLLKADIDNYGVATLKDFYSYVGIVAGVKIKVPSSKPCMTDWGWHDVSEVRIVPKNDGWLMTMPKIEKLPSSRVSKESEDNMPYNTNDYSVLNIINDPIANCPVIKWTNQTSTEPVVHSVAHVSTPRNSGRYPWLQVPNKMNTRSWLIKKIETYNDRVVKVTFQDGTFRRAVCSKNDTFDIDVGITICLLKYLFGANDANKIYNNTIRDCHKIIAEQEKEKKLRVERKEKARAEKRKAELKKAARQAKARQELIDIQTQAYLNAMRKHEEEGGGDM